MTLREKILSMISDSLIADETILQPDELDSISALIFEASALSDSAVSIFGDSGSEFIDQVQLLFGKVADFTTIRNVFPKAINLITILKIVNQLDVDHLDVEVPAEIGDFSIRETILETYNKNGERLQFFIYENPSNFNNSVCLLDLRSNLNFTSQTFNHPVIMAACVTILISGEQIDLAGRAFTIATVENEDSCRSYCKYHLLLAGHLLTNPVFAPSTIALQGIAETLQANQEYNQFGEPFEILGEINSRTTVLDTLLSCYHVVENYMIRAKIAKVIERHNSPTLFGIRNFKQMEIAVDNREIDHLKNLINECWDKSIGCTTFRDYVVDHFNAFLNAPGFVHDRFYNFMDRLAVLKVGGAIDVGNDTALRNVVTKLLYQVRCSIVHNKETEFHLSNRELSDRTVRTTLSELCLPIMQRLAFGLPSVPAPNPLLYVRRELVLY